MENHGQRLTFSRQQELLAKERVVWEAWKSPTMYQLIFASGIITTLTVNPQTGDLTRVAFDKFLVGKLLSEHLADGELSWWPSERVDSTALLENDLVVLSLL